MKSDFLKHGVTALSALAVFCLTPGLAVGQAASAAAAGAAKAVAAEASKPTPHTADGHPDLSGTWGGGGGLILSKDGDSIKANLPGPAAALSEDPDQKQAFLHHDDHVAARKADTNQPPYKPELMAKVKELDLNENKVDPAFFCKPEGVPRIGTPTQIVQAPGLVVFLYATEKGNAFRDIPTDGRQHDPTDTDTYYGDSVGHWDGDTLVVDSVGFTDDTWLGFDGWFHSTAMHVIERFTRDGDTLHYQATVEDPNVFTRPWVMNPRTVKLGHDLIVENAPCIEKDEDHMVDRKHH